MNRKHSSLMLALLAVGLLWTTPANANENEADLRAQLDELKQQVSELQSKRAENVDTEIEAYLDSDTGWANEAQGDAGTNNVTITAMITSVNQNTVDQDDNRSLVSGMVELNFAFKVTDNLSIFTNLFANTNGHLDAPGGFANGDTTLAAAYDGNGVDSTVLNRANGGVQVHEAGFNWTTPLGGIELDMTFGLIDPRYRYLTSAFGDDFRTGFLNNQFVDQSAISWATTRAGGNILGANFMMAFGGEKQFVLQFGYYNGPGRFFDFGQLYIEIHWKGEISGRAMNVKAMVMLDALNNVGSDMDTQYGVHWDWMMTDTIGLFASIAGNSEDSQAVEMSWTIGAVFMGLISSRPDDEIGIAIGMLTGNDTFNAALTEDELIVEAYYRYTLEGGKLQFTPHVQFISDPGGGATFSDDTLFILGIRVHVPF